MTVLILLTLWWNAEILLREYPPDVRQAHGPMSRKSRRQHIAASVVFVAVFIAILVISYRHLAVMTGGGFTFWTASLHAVVLLTVFNLFDLIVIDWLIGIKWQPGMLVLPGTEGLSGYDVLWFHVRGFFF